MTQGSTADPTWSDEALVAAIVHQSEDAIIGMDLGAVIRTWNAAAQRMYGYTQAEAVGRHVSILFPKDRREEFAATVARAVGGERIESYETVRRHQDGSAVEVSVSLTGLRDPAGELSGLAAIHRDISSRRRAEAGRREAESRYRSLAEQIPAVTYMETFEPRESIYISPQVQTLLGVTPGEWAEDPGLWRDALHPHDREATVQAWARLRETGEPFDAQYRMITRDGRVVWIHDRAVLLRDEVGEPRFIQGLMFDITDPVRVHEDLVRSLSLTQAALDSTADGILVVGRDGRTEGFNQRFAEMWRIPEDLLKTRDDDRMIGFVLDQLVDPDAFVAKVRALYDDPEASSFDTIAFRDGRVFERYSLPQRMGDEIIGRVWSFRDITERRRADEARRDAETRYRTLVEQIPAIVYTADFAPAGRWAYVSPQVEALLGYGPEEWTADPTLFEERLHPDDRDRYLAEEAAAARSGSLAAEYRLLARDGSVRWFRDAATVVEGPGGRFLRGVMFDVTEAREATAALQQSEERYRTLWEDSPISLWEEDLSSVKAYIDDLRARGVHDVAGHVDRHPEEALAAASGILAVDANIASLALFEADSKDELLGPIAPYAGEEARFGHRGSILAIARGDRSVDFEVVNTTLRGRRLDLLLRWVVAPGHETTYSRVLLSLVDVTARRRAEEEVREAESRFRTIVESSLDAIVTMDDRGLITGWNPQAETIFGWRAEEVLGHELGEVVIPPGDREAHGRGLARYFEPGLARVLGRRIELTALHRDGSTFPVELAINELRHGGRVSFSGFVRDITERVRAEGELRDSLDALRRTTRQRQLLLARLQRAQEEERERIGADIHDDSIQAMVAVGMRLAMLRRRLRDPSEEDEEAFRELERTVEQAVARLRHLLFDLRPPALDREGLAAALRLYLGEMQQESGLRYALESRLVGEPPIETRISLYRIAQEALANVRKHARAERVEVLLQDRDRGVLVRIRDDGRGFDRDRVAQPKPGHLGVTAMQERTEAGGGWLRIDTSPGAGTTVEFWMPVVPETAEATA